MCDTKNYFSEIKSVQDILRKDSLQEYYRNTILGFTILKRLIGTLQDTQEDVNLAFSEMEKSKEYDEKRLYSESEHGYYNTSNMTFASLLSDPQMIFENTKKMIESFSPNVSPIFCEKGLNLVKTAKALKDKKALYGVIEKYEKLDFSKMANTDFGVLFGQLIAQVYGNVENGQNWSPSDFVNVLTELLLAEEKEKLGKGYNRITLLDNAVGSGQLTSHFEKTVREMNSENNVVVYGQDNSDLSIAICKAEQIMVGQKSDNFVVADSLTTDGFPNVKFDYVLQNAPYGCGRKKNNEEKIKEYLGEDLPSSSDNQMLFWKAAINKLKPDGKAALLSNGSPLFSGGVNSGEGKIRKWLFDNDYVEAIIQLTDQGFIDTGITIYAWVINKNKPEKRKNWVQLIDASNISHVMKKSVGNKRKEMTDEDIKEIVSLYTNFNPSDNNELVKYMTKEDFYYREVTIEQPYQRNFKITEDRIENLYSQSTFSRIFDEEKYNDLLLEFKTKETLKNIETLEKGKETQDLIIDTLKSNVSDKIYTDESVFKKVITNILSDLVDKKYVKTVVEALSEKDKTSKTYVDKKSDGGLKADNSLKDTELIPYKKDVDEYFNEEVKPFVPDAWIKRDYDDKVGCEINFNKYFYKYVEPRKSEDILKEILALTDKENDLLKVIMND